jgi:hypothetical protein
MGLFINGRRRPLFVPSPLILFISFLPTSHHCHRTKALEAVWKASSGEMGKKRASITAASPARSKPTATAPMSSVVADAAAKVPQCDWERSTMTKHEENDTSPTYR